MKRLIKVFKLSAILLVSLILLAEIVLRIGFHEKLKTNQLPQIYQTDSLLGYKYIPNSSSKLVKPSINKSVKVNNQGYLGKDFTTQKKKGQTRIAFVGSSNVAGMATNGNENYVSYLGKLFDTSPLQVEVLNCAVDGGGRKLQHLHQITSNVVNVNPDIVFLENSPFPYKKTSVYRTRYKDFQVKSGKYLTEPDDSVKKYIDDNFYSNNLFTLTYDVSYIFRLFCKFYTENKNKATKFVDKYVKIDSKMIRAYRTRRINYLPKNPKPLSMSESIDTLNKLRKFLDLKGIKLVLYDYAKGAPLIEDICHLNNIGYLNLKLKEAPGFYLKHDGHYSQLGHAVIAEQLHKGILNNHLLQESYWIDKLSDKKIRGSVGLEKLGIRTIGGKNAKSFNNNNLLFIKSNKLCDSCCPGHSDLIEEKLKEGGSKITKVENESANMIAFIKQTEREIIKQEPRYAIIEIPNKIFNFRTALEDCQLLSAYIKDLENTGCKVFLYSAEIKGSIEYLYAYFSNNPIFKINTGFPKHVKKQASPQHLNYLKHAHLSNTMIDTLTKMLQADGAIRLNTNLAFGKKVTASSSSERKKILSKNNLVDGRPYSVWSKNMGWRNEKQPRDSLQWVQIDLAKEYKINKIIIYPSYDPKFAQGQFPKNITIRLSADNINWQTVYQKKDIPAINITSPQVFKITTTHARYVKIEGEGLRVNHKSGDYTMSFAEVEVY